MMRKKSLLLLMLSLSLILGACASIVEGDNQIMSVETPNCENAKCKFTNEQGTYFVSETPGTVSINKSASPLIIECGKAGKKEIMNVESGTEGMAFGNILAGGIIGAAVDMSTGAAYVYPTSVQHPLECP